MLLFEAKEGKRANPNTQNRKDKTAKMMVESQDPRAPNVKAILKLFLRVETEGVSPDPPAHAGPAPLARARPRSIFRMRPLVSPSLFSCLAQIFLLLTTLFHDTHSARAIVGP